MLTNDPVAEVSECDMCYFAVLGQYFLESVLWICDDDSPGTHHWQSPYELNLAHPSIVVNIQGFEVLPELVVHAQVNKHVPELRPSYVIVCIWAFAFHLCSSSCESPDKHRLCFKQCRQLEHISDAFINFSQTQIASAVVVEAVKDLIASFVLFRGDSERDILDFVLLTTHKLYISSYVGRFIHRTDKDLTSDVYLILPGILTAAPSFTLPLSGYCLFPYALVILSVSKLLAAHGLIVGQKSGSHCACLQLSLPRWACESACGGKYQVVFMPQPAKRERKDVAKIIAERPFAAEDYTSSTLTRSEVEEIKAAFDILDPERVGTIDPAELCSAFSSLGFARQSPFVAQQLQRLKSKKQPIPFKQFLDLATRSLLHTENRQDTQKLFNLFDHEQKGKISAQDLQRVAQSLGDSLTEEQLSKIIAKADSDQDGLLTVDDFYEILSKR